MVEVGVLFSQIILFFFLFFLFSSFSSFLFFRGEEDNFRRLYIKQGHGGVLAV